MGKKNRGYEIDFTTNTFYMNYKFEKEAKDVFSKEYEILQKVQKDFPNKTQLKRSSF